MYIELKKGNEIISVNADVITITEMEYLSKDGWIVINYVGEEKEV